MIVSLHQDRHQSFFLEHNSVTLCINWNLFRVLDTDSDDILSKALFNAGIAYIFQHGSVV